MRDLSQRIANLSPEKRALLELRFMKKGTAFAKDPAIARRDTLDPCPVSFAQQRLWFLDHFEPDSPVYNIPAAVPPGVGPRQPIDFTKQLMNF